MRLAVTALAGGIALAVMVNAAGPVPPDWAYPATAAVCAVIGVASLHFLWSGVRAFRDARKGALGRDVAVIAMIAAVLTAGWSARSVTLLLQGKPIADALWVTIAGPLWSVSVRGSDLVVRGQITAFMEREMAELAREETGVTRVVLHSGGGSVGSANRIARLVAREGWDTHVPRGCASACLDIFLAGDQRTLGPGAVLGCHQTSNALTGEPAGPALTFRRWPTPPQAEDVRRRIVAACDATPPQDIYRVPLDELQAIGAVTGVTR